MIPLRHLLLVAVLACTTAFAQSSAPVLRIPGAAQPQLTAAPDGAVWLVYGQTPPAPAGVTPKSGEPKSKRGGHGHGAASRPDGDVFVAKSLDGGATFAAAVKVGTVPKLMLGRRRGPRIAAHGERITVTVIAHELIAFSSTDGGRTWTGPVTINDVATSAREGLHDLAGAADGKLFVTWLDLRNGAMELWSAESADGGRTWGRNELVHRSPGKSICECCHPSALFDRDGNLAVMWRNAIEGSRDMWMSIRPKGAAQFMTPQKLGTGTWKLDACPMDGGRIAPLGGGRFGAVWQRAGEVFLSAADGTPERLLGKGTQPVIATQGGETLVFWQQGTQLMRVSVPGSDTPKVHTANATFASIVAPSTYRRPLLAYEQLAPGETQPSVVVERL